MSIRYYSDVAAPTTLTQSVSGSTATLQVASVNGFPVQFPYTLILDQGTNSEELVEVTSANGLTLTVTRGVDTTGLPHAANASVIHGVSARDYRDSRTHESAAVGVHGLPGNAAVVGTTNAQTLTNKTLVNPVINGQAIGTGFVPVTTNAGASVNFLSFNNVGAAPNAYPPGVSITNMNGPTGGFGPILTISMGGAYIQFFKDPGQGAQVRSGYGDGTSWGPWQVL